MVGQSLVPPKEVIGRYAHRLLLVASGTQLDSPPFQAHVIERLSVSRQLA